MNLEIDDKLLEEVVAEEAAANDEPTGVLYEESDSSELEADPPGEDGHPDPGLAPPPGLIRIDNLVGVPLLYQGDGSTPRPTSFRLMPVFKPVLEATVRQLQARAPHSFGALRQIVSLGMWTDKHGAHGQGVANDWDRIRFANVEISPRNGDHNSSSLPKRQRYWAFAAICRSNAAYVLHGFYNADHANHIHHDIVGKMPFDARSTTNVQLFQAVLNDIFAATPRLEIDGNWGQKSRSALAAAQHKVGIAGDVTTDVVVLQKFLRAAGRLGLRLSALN